MFDFLLPGKKRKKSRPSRKASAPENLSLPDVGLDFTLQRDHCRTLRLTVKPDASVRVKAPVAVPLEDILLFVRSRLAWIREKQGFFLEHRGSATNFCDGSTILFLGRPFRLCLVPGRRGNRPSLTAGRLELPCRSSITYSATNSAICAAWTTVRISTPPCKNCSPMPANGRKTYASGRWSTREVDGKTACDKPYPLFSP